MSTSAASKLLSFNNNRALQRLILLQSAAGGFTASITRLLKKIPESEIPSPHNKDAQTPYAIKFTNDAEILKKKPDAAVVQFPLGMLALGGVDQSGFLKIHTLPSKRNPVVNDDNEDDKDVDDDEDDGDTFFSDLDDYDSDDDDDVGYKRSKKTNYYDDDD